MHAKSHVSVTLFKDKVLVQTETIIFYILMTTTNTFHSVFSLEKRKHSLGISVKLEKYESFFSKEP